MAKYKTLTDNVSRLRDSNQLLNNQNIKTIDYQSESYRIKRVKLLQDWLKELEVPIDEWEYQISKTLKYDGMKITSDMIYHSDKYFEGTHFKTVLANPTLKDILDLYICPILDCRNTDSIDYLFVGTNFKKLSGILLPTKPISAYKLGFLIDSKLLWENIDVTYLSDLTYAFSPDDDVKIATSSITKIPYVFLPNAKTTYGIFYGCTELTEVGDIYIPNASGLNDDGMRTLDIRNNKQVSGISQSAIGCMFVVCPKLVKVGDIHIENAKRFDALLYSDGLKEVGNIYSDNIKTYGYLVEGSGYGSSSVKKIKSINFRTYKGGGTVSAIFNKMSLEYLVIKNFGESIKTKASTLDCNVIWKSTTTYSTDGMQSLYETLHGLADRTDASYTSIVTIKLSSVQLTALQAIDNNIITEIQNKNYTVTIV